MQYLSERLHATKAGEEAFAAAFDRAVGEGCALLAKAAPADLPWPERLREGLGALLEAIAANPERARMVLVEGQRGGPALLAHYEVVIDAVALKLREGRLLDSAVADLPGTLEETTAAGLVWLLRERLETIGPEGIEEMLPRLLDVALGPYLGAVGSPRVVAAPEAG